MSRNKIKWSESQILKLHLITELKTLFISIDNTSREIVKRLPVCITELGLTYSDLTDVPDLTHLTGLDTLRLYSNQISMVSVDRIPPTVTFINLNNNRLTDIDLSPLTRLRTLWLSDNPTLTSLTGLPDSLTDLWTDL